MSLMNEGDNKQGAIVFNCLTEKKERERVQNIAKFPLFFLQKFLFLSSVCRVLQRGTLISTREPQEGCFRHSPLGRFS